MFKRVAKIMLLMAVFVSATAVATYLTVHLLIQSEDTVIVPEVVGKEVVQTLERLSDLGLNTKVKGSEYDASVPKHHIIYQDPEPGSEIKRGRDVRIVISKGAQTVVLPNLVGMGLPQARIFLDENDLRQGQASYTYDPAVPKEEILSQYPRAGFLGLREDAVDLLISAGPPPQVIPMVDLRGLVFHQAVEIIEKLHLTSGAIRSIREAGLADGTVVDHQPAAGYPVMAGSAVAFSVNHGATPAAVRGHRSGTALFRHRAAPGFLKEHVRVRLNRLESTVELFDDFVKPGREIWLLVPKEEPATLFLYVDEELIHTTHYE
ncbi:MAG: PASTA domain-containing protein [Desulfatitalea sp.]|nr:PASTA domain-containing protein [Desulfatitalea sp.]